MAFSLKLPAYLKFHSALSVAPNLSLADSFSIVELAKSPHITFAYPESSAAWLKDLNLVFLVSLIIIVLPVFSRLLKAATEQCPISDFALDNYE